VGEFFVDFEKKSLTPRRKGAKNLMICKGNSVGEVFCFLPDSVYFWLMGMKSSLVITAVFAGMAFTFADEATELKRDVPLSASIIVQIKAQEFAHALVQLKLKEVELKLDSSANQQTLTVVRAQERAFNEELLKLVVVPLELQLQKFLKIMRADNPDCLQLREKIDKARLEIMGEASPSPQPIPTQTK
jgi:hypothetical protein